LVSKFVLFHLQLVSKIYCLFQLVSNFVILF